MGKRKLLAAFLEKDNLKLLVYDVSGRSATRQFAGQITFSPDTVKDAFIAEPAKFSGQVKIAFAQKPLLAEVGDVVLFVPPDKVFTKTIPAADGIENFVRTLPYFKEELILQSEEPAKSESQVTHVAFEKKLVEDLERPFLESGKKVESVVSTINVLARANTAEGKYFLLAPFDKEVAVAAVENGGIYELAAFPKDVFAGRFHEFVVGKNLTEIKNVFTVGVFEEKTLEKLQSERGLVVGVLATGDVYDLAVSAYLKSAGGGSPLTAITGLLSNLPSGQFPMNKRLFILGAAIVVGILLVAVVGRGLIGKKFTLPSFGLGQKPAPKVEVKAPPAPPPAPEPKPSDYKVRVLNGTLVTGEATKLGDSLKGMGFDVVETKNATASGFVATRLRVTSDVPQKITDMLNSTLSGLYQSVTVEPLTDTAVQVEIIIGKKK